MMDKNLQNNNRELYIFAMKIVGDFGASIAVPVVILVILGQYLDKKFNVQPWFTISAFAVAAIISGIIIYRKSKQYGIEYQKLTTKIK